MTLTQFNTTVSGTAELGSIQIPVSGAVGTDDGLSLTGQGRAVDATFVIADWRSRVTGQTMTGTFEITLMPDALSGGTIRMGAALDATR